MSSNISESLKVLERQVSLLLLPIIIFSIDWGRNRRLIFIRVFLLTLAVFCLFSFCCLIWFYIENQEWIGLMNNEQDNNSYLQFKFPHLVGVHPTYWSYLLIYGNMLVLANYDQKIFKFKYLATAFCALFNIAILILASRTPLTINIVIHLMALFMFAKQIQFRFKRHLVVNVILSFSLGLLVVFKSNFLQDKFNSLLVDDRFYLWPVAFSIIKENFFLAGEGLGLGINSLKNFIIENGDYRKNYNSFDLHNQYLRHYLDLGLIGLIGFAYLVFHPIFLLQDKVLRQSLFLKYSLVALFAVASLSEAPFYRLKGIVLFAIIFPITIVMIKNRKAKLF